MEISKKVLVTDYLEKYPDLFFDYEKFYILSSISDGCSVENIPDILREIYDELGLIDDDINLYVGFIELIEKEFGIKNKNILEVGGGILPRLGERISLKQDVGSITVYDPRLSRYKKDTDKLKLVRKEFTRDTKMEDIDLMLGLMPCKAAEIILDTAIANDIDFMVALCEGGFHGDEDDYFEDEDEWIHSLIQTAKAKMKNRQMGDLKIQYMKKYGNPYPVISNNRFK